MTRSITRMSIDDAGHYSPEARAVIIAGYPAHEREARTRGIPTLGSGRVFPISDEAIEEEAIAPGKHWPVIGGLDFGWDHPTAAVKIAWDRDADCIHILNAYRVREQTPVFHAAALLAWGERMPWAWPHDGLQHDKGSGDQLAEQFRKRGLNMLPERAQFDDGSSGLEAGISEMLDRMQTGRWKVAKHLTEWFDEFRLYHRKDGLIVKERDDLISASRYAMMMLRYADVNRDKAEWHRGPQKWIV